MPEWIWWVGGSAVYVFIIGVAYSVFREENSSSDKDDAALFGAVIWPATLALLIVLGIGNAGFTAAESVTPRARKKREAMRLTKEKAARAEAKRLELEAERELGIHDG